MNIAIGTVQFGKVYGVANQNGQVSIKEILNILNIARSNGIDMLDTAAIYGNSEETLGKAGVKDFDIITKIYIGNNNEDIYKKIESEVEKSLKKLKIESLYGLLLHDINDFEIQKREKIIEVIGKIKEKGKIKKFGLSIYDPDQIKDYTETYCIDIIQAPLNIIDRRLVNSGLLNSLKKNNVEVHSRSVFLQGLLLMKKSDIPNKFNKWEKIWGKWDHFLSDNDISPISACLNYPKSICGIDKILVGVDNSEQLIQIIEGYINQYQKIFPDIENNDMLLINPYNWSNI